MPKFVSAPHYSHSGFLTYWYDNSDAELSISALMGKTAADLIQPALDNFLDQKKQLQSSLSSMARSEKEDKKLLELLDFTTYQGGLEKYMKDKISADINTNANGINISSIDQAYEYLRLAGRESENLSKKISLFMQGYQKILDALNTDGKHKSVITRVRNALLGKYCEEAQQRGKVDISNEMSKGGLLNTQTARLILEDILKRTNNNAVFDNLAIKDGRINQQEINGIVKRLLMISAALPTFQNSNTGLAGMSVNHSNGNVTETETENDIINALIKKTRGMLSNLKGTALEMAVAYGFLKAHIDDGAYNAFKRGLTVKPTRIGNNSYDISISSINTNNKSFLDELDEMKKTAKAFQQRSKADAAIVVKKNKVEAHIGFSIKTSKSITFNEKLGTVDIKIQDGTPLFTLLGREMALDSEKFQAVMQLLAGHGSTQQGAAHSDIMLNEKWKDIKQQLLYLGFVNALTGSTTEGKAYFMIIGNKIYSMEQIIKEAQKGSKGLFGVAASYAEENKVDLGLQREPYLTINAWKPFGETGKAPKHEYGIERGTAAWKNVSKMLYDTKVRISMTTQDLAKLVS